MPRPPPPDEEEVAVTPLVTPALLTCELDFLLDVDAEPGQPLYSEGPLKEALRRYERCWVKFVKDVCGDSADKDLEWAPPRGKNIYISSLEMS